MWSCVQVKPEIERKGRHPSEVHSDGKPRQCSLDETSVLSRRVQKRCCCVFIYNRPAANSNTSTFRLYTLYLHLHGWQTRDANSLGGSKEIYHQILSHAPLNSRCCRVGGGGSSVKVKQCLIICRSRLFTQVVKFPYLLCDDYETRSLVYSTYLPTFFWCAQ